MFSLRHYSCESVAAAVIVQLSATCACGFLPVNGITVGESVWYFIKCGITPILHGYKNSPSNNYHNHNIIITLVAVVITVE